MMIRVSDASHVGDARRHAAVCAEQLTLGETERGAVAIVVTEMVTNLVKHVGLGLLMIESIAHNGNRGLRVQALDKGPGISDLGRALQDGHSTAGTPGNGLGAIRRLAHVFDIYSLPGRGTAVLAEVWAGRKIYDDRSGIEVGVVSVPMQGEDDCGDGWGMKQTAESVMLMVVDGLGHGTFAAEAAREAERIFAASGSGSPAPILQQSHDSLRKTRGAAMAIASLNLKRKVLSFAGVGNIGASIVSPDTSRGMASHNGIIGHQLRTVQEFSFPWSGDSVLIMHSDGLSSRWDLKPYPGIWSRHPALMAALLYRDFSRERDDATVLVARNRKAAGAS